MSKINLKSLTAEELQAEITRREKEAQDVYKKKKSDYLADKNTFLEETLSRFQEVRAELIDLKEVTISQINNLYDRMYELHDKKPKKQKTITQKSECGNYKVTAERKEKFEFTEEADVHIGIIREILKSKFEKRNRGLYELLDSILMKNGKGDYDPNLLAKARKKANELGYPELIEQFQKLQDCQRVTGTALYCRAYHKDEKGAWKDVVIQFSTL
jgi:hypothetical protein